MAMTSYVVPSEEGPHRKYCGISNEGRSMLDNQRKVWSEFSTTMNKLLEGKVRA